MLADGARELEMHWQRTIHPFASTPSRVGGAGMYSALIEVPTCLPAEVACATSLLSGDALALGSADVDSYHRRRSREESECTSYQAPDAVEKLTICSRIESELAPQLKKLRLDDSAEDIAMATGALPAVGDSKALLVTASGNSNTSAWRAELGRRAEEEFRRYRQQLFRCENGPTFRVCAAVVR
mmetsp:Transcript_121821/g.192952  ORF Transcript_121821/g.192952 Transcript_121821/m.192952 type:complete len:184 (+) Transcript_121821:46-597(+)